MSPSNGAAGAQAIDRCLIIIQLAQDRVAEIAATGHINGLIASFVGEFI